eukprot:2569709-Rhodomonas_salina.3
MAGCIANAWEQGRGGRTSVVRRWVTLPSVSASICLRFDRGRYFLRFDRGRCFLRFDDAAKERFTGGSRRGRGIGGERTWRPWTRRVAMLDCTRSFTLSGASTCVCTPCRRG